MFKTLKQGEQFNQYQKKLKKKVKDSNLALISVGKLNIMNNLNFESYSSVKEGMQSGPPDVSLNPVEAQNDNEKQQLAQLEGEFNEKIVTYTNIYKKYLEELASRQSSVNVSFKNQLVKYNNDYYYINNMGVSRQFSDSAWDGRDQSTCPSTSTKNITDEEMARLSRGTPMGIGEMCRSGGYNATTGKATAWVDNQGYKHLHNDFRNKHTSCPDSTVTVSDIQFDAIPTGNSYGSDDKCEVMSLDSENYDKLQKLNNDLMNIVKTMHTNVQNLATKDKTLEDKVDGEKKKLLDTYNELNKMKKKVDSLKTANETLKAEANDQYLDSSAIQFHHLIWVVVGCAFIATAIRNMRD